VDNMSEDKISVNLDKQTFIVSNEFGLKQKVIGKIWNHIQAMWILTLIIILIIHFW